MSVETTSSLSGAAQEYWNRSLLTRLLPLCVMSQFGIDGDIPPGWGKVMKFRRYGVLAPATTPLTEGVPPAGSNKSLTTLNGTVRQYGDFLKDSDVLLNQGYDDIMAVNIQLLAEQAAQTIDLVAQPVLAAGTNVVYADGVADRVHVAAGNKWTADNAQLCVRNLERSSVPRFPDGYYVGIVDADVAATIRKDTRWIDAQKYGGTKRLFNGEIGELDGIRYVQTQNAPVFAGAGAGGIDVHRTMYLGQGAYGKVGSKHMDQRVIIKPLGSAGAADPLNQYGTVGWILNFVCVILEQARIVGLESSGG